MQATPPLSTGRPGRGRRHPARTAPVAAARSALAALGLLALLAGPAGAQGWSAERFDAEVQPILEDYCFGCHGNGLEKGGVSLDGLADDDARRQDRDLWWAVLKNVRAGIMPPADQPQPSDEDRALLADWIKFGAFGIDPAEPDPGRVTVRRLNRIEYRNTVRDLLGVDYDTSVEFPPDDTGHGFDNIGDVLTLSPLLLEKYLAAARTIVERAVPTTARVVPEQTVAGRRFRVEGAPVDEPKAARGGRGPSPLVLSYYEPAAASAEVEAPHDGRYQLVVDLTANERYVDNVFDLNRCRLVFRVDGEELHRQEFSRQDGKPFRLEFDRDWKAGKHTLRFEVEPLTPDAERVRSLSLRVYSVTVRGPMDEKYGVPPANYRKFFPRDVPDDEPGRRAYARELLGRFATRAFRRPVEDETLDRLVGLASSLSDQPGQSFEAGVAQAMVAILASPRFLFREEGIEPGSTDRYPLVDEYALASRLSYFLWSTMPDDELFRLAAAGELRANLKPQVDRMLADPRSNEFIRHFIGQWLQARDIETVLINAQAVLARDEIRDPEAERRRARFRELVRKPAEELTPDEKAELDGLRGSFFRSFRRFRDFELTGDLRRAMRRETEMLFEHVVREDRSLLELLDCDYTFLNGPLAKYYGIEGVEGDQMRRVELPPDSPRGGVLTQGTVLAVTSNPDRTSPVKRGLFILENILGTPPAPPPPDIPPLEDAGKQFGDRVPTLRETLALHRDKPLCASCHNRMDPLGLALENFNALGRFREKERADPIDPSGRLITGEAFANVRELKRILVSDRRHDYYHCMSEKLLTYALGRGLSYPDVQTLDVLVERLEREGGRASALIAGVIESPAFQRRQRPASTPPIKLSDRTGSTTNPGEEPTDAQP